jgi:uncharacterized protein YbaR (Trm112 family)
MTIFPYPLVWPSLSYELAPFLKYCQGIVLNAGSGQREIELGERNFGIDIVPDNNPDIVADLHRIPLRDESVDTIVSIAVLEHTRYAWIVAQEFYRVLRPGGFGVIAVPFLQPQHACPYDFIRFTSNGLVELMEYVGFEVVETQHVHHFGQTLAWLLWEYLQYNKPWKITWPFWSRLLNLLSKGKILGGDSPNTHNTEYVIVHKPGDSSAQSPHYLAALTLSRETKDWFFPLLACPRTRQPLHRVEDCLISEDGQHNYAFKDGKPYLFPSEGEFRIKVNELKINDRNNNRVSHLVGMTSLEEQTYLREYAKKHYTAQGEIVDLGCWLGSLTIPLVMGLQENPNLVQDRLCVHAYDIFIWESWMEPYVVGTPLAGKYKDGDSFLDAFLEQTSPWKSRIQVYPGDLTQMSWEPLRIIEFLMIDAMKSWDLANSIIEKFFPALVPGLSIIQHQDFVHYYTSWIHLIMYRFRDYFEPLLYVPDNSLVFKYQRKIPDEILQQKYSFDDFSNEEINSAFEYSYSIVPEQARPNVAAAKVMLHIHLGDKKQALKELNLIKKTGLYSENSDFSIVENLLA